MENVYVMKSTSRYTGIHLTEREFEIIKYIHDFSVFPAGNIHRLFNSGHKKPRSKYAISMRLGKLVKSGILVQLKTDFPKQGENRPPQYAYRLGSRGFDLLIQEKVITQKHAERRKKYGPQLKMPTPHNKTVNTIFTELVERLIGSEESFKSLQCQYYRGDQHEEISYANSQTGYSPVIPDWIFDTKDQIICLELDTGRQINSIIKTKFDRYQRLARYLKKPLVVVFSVGLSTLANDDSPKEKRVGSLKQLFSEHTDWPEKFEVFVLPSHRTTDFLYKMLKNRATVTNLHAKGVTNSWLNFSRLASKQKVSYRMAQNENLNRLLFQDTYTLDFITELLLEDKIIPIGLLYMEEGSVRSYQKARTNMKRIQTWNTQFGSHKPSVSLFLVYNQTSNASNEILALQPACRTFIVNVEEVIAAAKSKEQMFPPMVEILTQYTKKPCKLL
ncbi:replication-relaxation family protein [Planomicrobium sp. MB-3u-38]|uniref:replication-relaxation family protein n=1 Tax=Planomicrobium sp. MB-3u-38 TaxID=2058318 RepID=UPI0013045415|nr:replication-relaxation family protein [Planomicrobium sp. MB-3u-38]